MNRPVCIGLDHASNRWHAVELDRDGQVIGTRECVIPMSVDADERRTKLHLEAVGYFMLLPADCWIFAEKVIAPPKGNGKTTISMGLSAGVVYAAHTHGIRLTWFWVDSNTWKADVLGSGAATKADAKAWSLEHGGSEDWDEDHHDAHCLAECGYRKVAVKDPIVMAT